MNNIEMDLHPLSPPAHNIENLHWRVFLGLAISYYGATQLELRLCDGEDSV